MEGKLNAGQASKIETVCRSTAYRGAVGAGRCDGQLGRGPLSSRIEKWASVMLGDIERGINEQEFGTAFPCVHCWKKILGFGADISKRLLKIKKRRGWGGWGWVGGVEVLPNSVRNGGTVSQRQHTQTFWLI